MRRRRRRAGRRGGGGTGPRRRDRRARRRMRARRRPPPRRCASWSARRRAHLWRNWTRTARFRGGGEEGRPRTRPRTRPGGRVGGRLEGIVERGVVGGRRGRGGVRVGVASSRGRAAAARERVAGDARARRDVARWRDGSAGGAPRASRAGAVERRRCARRVSNTRVDVKAHRIGASRHDHVGGQDVHVPIARGPSGHDAGGDIAGHRATRDAPKPADRKRESLTDPRRKRRGRRRRRVGRRGSGTRT